MFNIKNFSISLFTICLLSITLSSTTFAATPINVDKEAKQDLKNFVNIIISEKEHYGLSASDNVESNISLGEGYSYYEASYSAIEDITNKKNNVIPSIDTAFVDSGKYIFPIKAGVENIGVAFVEKENNKRSILKISNYNSLKADFDLSKSKLTEKLGKEVNDDDTILIYDEKSKLTALGFKGTSEYIVPLKDSSYLNSKKNSIKPALEYMKDLDNFNKSNVSHLNLKGGGGNISPTNNYSEMLSTPNVLLGVLLLVFLSGIIIYKFKKVKIQS